MGNSGAAAVTDERQVYRTRRERVLERLGDDAIMVLAATPELTIGRDTELRYVVDAELFYLTGYREPEAIAVIGPRDSAQPFTMFVRPRDADRELWTGVRGGVEAALEWFGADAAHPIAELGTRLADLLSKVDGVYARLDTGHAALDDAIKRALVNGRRARARTGRGPAALLDPGLLLDEMRAVKDAHEIRLIRAAADISVAAFEAVIPRIRPGAGAWEIEAALESGFRERGADGFAFPSIVASGQHATVLHYVANDHTFAAGDLVLLDAGARYRMYTADISRTLPVNGRFSGPQRDLYECVLRAHDAAFAVARPGAPAIEVHNAAVRELVEGLRVLGLVTASTDAALEDDSLYKKYYPHKTSHWLGLDVHDVGAYATRAGARALEPGMVLTIEPGLYIRADDRDAPEGLRGVGVRIEDDLLVTESGAENLTGALPVTAADVEAWIGPRS